MVGVGREGAGFNELEMLDEGMVSEKILKKKLIFDMICQHLTQYPRKMLGLQLVLEPKHFNDKDALRFLLNQWITQNNLLRAAL